MTASLSSLHDPLVHQSVNLDSAASGFTGNEPEVVELGEGRSWREMVLGVGKAIKQNWATLAIGAGAMATGSLLVNIVVVGCESTVMLAMKNIVTEATLYTGAGVILVGMDRITDDSYRPRITAPVVPLILDDDGMMISTLDGVPSSPRARSDSEASMHPTPLQRLSPGHSPGHLSL